MQLNLLSKPESLGGNIQLAVRAKALHVDFVLVSLRTYMVINVSSVQQYNGGLLPDVILLTLCDCIGEPTSYHEELLFLLQSKFPPKYF